MKKSWRCFHCDEVFSDHDAALDHFGRSLIDTPACCLDGGLVKVLRDTMQELHQYRQEDTALIRQVYALGSSHQTALVREEEKGYARGVKDGRGSVGGPLCGPACNCSQRIGA